MLPRRKGEYYLSEDEEALIAKITDTFAKTIVILNVGYPIDVTFAEKYAVAGLIIFGIWWNACRTGTFGYPERGCKSVREAAGYMGKGLF